MMRDDNLKSPGQQTASDAPSGLLAEVRLLNDDHTPMEVRGSGIEEGVR